jgi:threonine/homoserine/homoserine lactone efflux protein
VPTVLGVELGLSVWALFAGAGEQPLLVGWRSSRAGSFAEAAVVQLANPKLAVFMIAFCPLFVPPSGSRPSAGRC